MDPDLLRLLLAVLGVLLVLGIYLWDRYRRAVPPARNQRVVADPEPIVPDANPLDTVDEGNAVDPPPVVAEPQVTEVAPADPLDPEPAEIGDWSETAAPAEPQMSMNLHFDAHGDGDYLSTDPALADEVERKLIVILVRL